MAKNQNFEKRLKTCLDIDLKIIFSKHYIPGSKDVTCSSFTNRKYPKNVKNTFKKGHKMVKNQNFEKRLKTCLDIDLKIIFSKYYVPGSKCVTCSSFTDRKYPKNAKKYL